MKEFLLPGPKIKRWIAVFGIGLIGIITAALLLLSEAAVRLQLPHVTRIALGSVLAACSILLMVVSIQRCFDRIIAIFMPEKKGRLLDILSKQHLQKGPKIVCIGGGTGTYTALMGLKKYTSNLTAIVSMADSGGSAGRLRDEFGILPPGDVRRCLIALSEESTLLKELFQYRFEKGTLEGHSFGNLFLTALRNTTGSDDKAIIEASKILAIRGKVLPVTLSNSHLHAVLENGKVIKGETNIDIPKHDANLKIKKVYLHPESVAYTKAVQAIKEADLVIIGPGDLYTSVIPNLLVKGIREALKKTAAKKVYVCNLMTKHGETTGFTASMYLREIQKYADCIMDNVVLNSKVPKKSLLDQYRKEHSFLVQNDLDEIEKLQAKPVLANLLKEPILVRHDPDKLASVIMGLV